ncbi:DNA-directed RNA polymerase subunit beta [Streptococcus sobrinus]|uniref:DNA-directed RNA polymerase subunit beta n=1 Tax=Streptococcus sobrinus TaxID=1310 RepID=UPI0002D26DFD|nr:DNA-directed RNA polymerase subunit beta [Streptococcus sobrinus]AWN18713.1 DNA-directed RNA polymerase subunit beta [Streptococcus sobrinus]
MAKSGWAYVRHQLALILLVALLCLVFLAIGLMVGYAVLGEGHNPLAILSPNKWQELINKFTGK